MAKKEVKTDLWVASQLDKCKIQFTAQGSDVKEIDEALSTASKRGTGNAGYPEYVAVVNDFVITGMKIRLLSEIRIFVIPTRPILCMNLI